jgi:hypothetical protein
MSERSRKSFKIVSFVLSVLVYIAGLGYAAVRTYSLFASTINPDLIPVAVLGIIALEISAIALPIAIHYWTEVGIQRIVAVTFYIVDLLMISLNSVIDAARHSGSVVPEFLTAYATYMLPALPILCICGWALVWATDSASREADAIAEVKGATFDAMMQQMREATDDLDIREQVKITAAESARFLVGEVLGQQPKRLSSPMSIPAQQAAMQILSQPEIVEGDLEDTGKRMMDVPIQPTSQGNITIYPPQNGLVGWSLYQIAKGLVVQQGYSELDAVKAACKLSNQQVPPATDAQLIGRVKRVKRVPTIELSMIERL